MKRFALEAEFSFAGYQWYLPELRAEGDRVEFDVLVPLDIRRVRTVRARFQEREKIVQDDPLARARLEKELLPQLPWPRDVEVRLEGGVTNARGGLAVAGEEENAEVKRLRKQYPALCGEAFSYDCHQGTLSKPFKIGKEVAFTVRQVEKSIPLALPFSIPGDAPCFCHPLTGARPTLELRQTRLFAVPWDNGQARRLWTYAVMPPLGQGESLSIREAHRQEGGAVGLAVREREVAGAFSSEPYDPAQPPQAWEFFLERLILPAPPLQVRAALRQPR